MLMLIRHRQSYFGDQADGASNEPKCCSLSHPTHYESAGPKETVKVQFPLRLPRSETSEQAERPDRRRRTFPEFIPLSTVYLN